MKISGTFTGTGAALSIGIGFIPDWVMVQNITSANMERILWSINSRSLSQIEGLQYKEDSGITATDLAFGEGIAIYRGGVRLSTASTSVLVADPIPDKRKANTAAAPIDTWTLGSAANRTGNWNAECNTSFVGVGSRICVRDNVTHDLRWATVLAITSNGEQANEVTLNEAVPSGSIMFVSGMNDFVGGGAGITTPAGFTINETGDLNVAAEKCFFEAGTYMQVSRN